MAAPDLFSDVDELVLLLLYSLFAVVLLLALAGAIIYTAYPRRKRNQSVRFSLRSALIAVTAAAVLLWMIGVLVRLAD